MHAQLGRGGVARCMLTATGIIDTCYALATLHALHGSSGPGWGAGWAELGSNVCRYASP